MRSALALLLLLSLGCSKKTEAPDAGPGGLCGAFTGAGVASATVCADVARATCDRWARCGTADPAFAAQCEALAQQGCDQSALDRGLFRLDAARAQCCLEVTRTAGCSGAEAERVRQACQGGFELPNVAPGGACDDSRDCIPADDAGHTGCFRGWEPTSCGGTCSAGVGLGEKCSLFPGVYCLQGWCDYDPATYLGTCKPFAALGAACDPTSCAPDAFCSGGACAPRAGAGAACTEGSCQAGLHCFAGRCAPTGQTGDACDPGDEHACAGYAFCVGGHCTPGSAHAGEPCGGPVGCLDGFCSGDFDAGGVCQPEPGLGDACQGSFRTCGSGYVCDGGTCVAPPGVGEPCPGGTCKFGLACDRATGTCRPIPGPGEVCSGSAIWGCFGGYCDRDAGTCQPFRAPFTACEEDFQCAAVSDAYPCRPAVDGGPKVCVWCAVP